MKKAAFFLLFCGLSSASFAQSNKPGKPLTVADSGTVRQLFFSAIREKTIENVKLASELFNRVIQIDPDNDASLYELAILEKIQKNYPAARPLLEKAVTLSPDNEWYWSALADSYEKANEIAKLENVFNNLIRINPAKPDYYFDRANVYMLQRKYDDALRQYDEVEKITGQTDDLLANRQRIFLKQGKIDRAAAEIDKFIEANPGQVRYYLMQADLYNANGMNNKALATLERAKKAGLSSGLLNLATADVYRDKKNEAGSLGEIKIAMANPDIEIDQKIRIILGYVPQFNDKAIKANTLELARILVETHPKSDKAFAIYGDMLVQNEKYREARLEYKKSVDINAQSYAVQEQLVRLEMAESDFDSAVKDGESALGYFPNQAWMNCLVGLAWQQKKNYNKAISYLTNAVSLESPDKELLIQAYSALGDCYHSISDHKNSDDSYDKALSYNPDNTFTLNNYAYYLSLRNEQLVKAAAMSKRSNDLQPNTASFEDTYAWILFKQKNYPEAKVWIEKSIQHDKENSATKTEHYGDILFFLGDTAGALQNWAKAKAQGGGSPLLDKKINEKKYME